MENNVQIAGVSFTVVNPLSEEVMELTAKVIAMYLESSTFGSNDWTVVKKTLKYLGGGYCGRLFHLTDDLIIKFETGDYSDAKDGEALHELQGLAHVPKVYLYNTHKQITIIQKIQGSNIKQYERGEADFSLVKFDGDRVIESVKETIEKMYSEREWIPSDLHSENVMVDVEGNFWIVDFGCFERVSRWHKERRMQGDVPYTYESDRVQQTISTLHRTAGRAVKKKVVVEECSFTEACFYF